MSEDADLTFPVIHDAYDPWCACAACDRRRDDRDDRNQLAMQQYLAAVTDQGDGLADVPLVQGFFSEEVDAKRRAYEEACMESGPAPAREGPTWTPTVEGYKLCPGFQRPCWVEIAADALWCRSCDQLESDHYHTGGTP